MQDELDAAKHQCEMHQAELAELREQHALLVSSSEQQQKEAAAAQARVDAAMADAQEQLATASGALTCATSQTIAMADDRVKLLVRSRGKVLYSGRQVRR
jgi:ElaB/YqjD/DUF883 family membrane-anchored ribosome-binding protein